MSNGVGTGGNNGVNDLTDDEIEAKLVEIDDLGATSSIESMERVLQGTEHLMDTHPRVSYYWGMLLGLQLAANLQSIY